MVFYNGLADKLDDCLIKRFFIGHHKELVGMLDREYKEPDAKELFMEEGRTQGEDRKLVKLICYKLRIGKQISSIAYKLEEDEGKKKAICDVAKAFATDYDESKVISTVEALEMAV